MAFEVIPAVDVAHGRLAVAAGSGVQAVEAFGGDPEAAVASYVAAGARWVHLVDLDRAYGAEGDGDLVGRVRAAWPDLRIQASGGIVDAAAGRRALAAGATRVVLASAGLADEGVATDTLRDLGTAVVVGIEVEDGAIRGRGANGVHLPLAETLGWASAAGAPAFLVTAVDRVAGLGGPDAGLIRRVVRAGRPVIAAGGVGSIDDLRSMREAGASAALVGRAAMDGRVDVAAAISALS